jgi:hypothetical protein
MRFIISKNGIQERLNYLIGTNDTDPGTSTGTVGDSGPTNLTSWSTQASMITNIRRVVKGIVGNSTNGKIMSGLQISQVNDTDIAISGGIGFTVAGNIIVLNPSSIQITLANPVSQGQEFPIYLMYGESFANPTIAIDYHLSEIMGTSQTPINIIADDICSNTNDTTTIQDQIKTVTQNLNTNDGLYLGTVVVTQTDPSVIMTITPPLYTTGGVRHITGNFTAYLNGFSSSDPNVHDGKVSGTAYYEVNGNICTILIPQLSGVAESAAHYLSGLPEEICPTTNYTGLTSTLCNVYYTGANHTGGFITNTYSNPWLLFAPFTGSGNEGIYSANSVITYYLS